MEYLAISSAGISDYIGPVIGLTCAIAITTLGGVATYRSLRDYFFRNPDNKTIGVFFRRNFIDNVVDE